MHTSDHLIVEGREVGAWTGEADLVVVGYGIAGVCGAIEAREAGAEVLVLERGSGCSGSTAIASGHFYLGGGTAVQRACGFEDTPEELAAYLTATTTEPDTAKIAAFANGSVALFDWLEERGVPFDRSYFPTKAVIQHGTECLIWTGNEKVWPYCEMARPAPRGHKVAFEGTEGGGNLALTRLIKHSARIGIQPRYDTVVEALVLEQGRVVGVRARHFGEQQYWAARSGVLLAGGGFGNNPEMMAEHLGRFAGVNIMGGPYDDGTAIRLGEAAGGVLDHMDGILVTSPIYPPEQLVKGILVNRDGHRFVAEDSYHTRTSLAIVNQPGGVAYLIVDSDVFTYPEWHTYANQRLVDGFASVREMAERLGTNAGVLEQTLDAYNRAARLGDDRDFHKQREWLKPLDEGPWAAFDFSFGRAVFNAFTLGGLRISSNAEVLDCGGLAVPGLYAAGACASMLAHNSENYASGISLSAGAFFGRSAGRHAWTSEG